MEDVLAGLVSRMWLPNPRNQTVTSSKAITPASNSVMQENSAMAATNSGVIRHCLAWILYSGCTQHMSLDRRLLDENRVLSKPGRGNFGGGAYAKSIAIGM